MKNLQYVITVAFCIGMIFLVRQCEQPKPRWAGQAPKPNWTSSNPAPTEMPAATEVPTVEPTPEPTSVPTYYQVTLWGGNGLVRKWRVSTDTKFELFGTGVNFKDDHGKDITICGTYTIEEE